MEKYKLRLQPTAEKDFVKHKKAGNKVVIKKITTILSELETHPYTGTGNPEPLKHELSGLWSRKITMKDRVIYEVNEKEVIVIILSAIGHYKDK